ncbi:hypothetical protein ACN9ML_18300 [Dyadobacter endophyticus]|uniref:hypothetical protein n=1 Tax=Dyadobacter endophyticus TaxID=1749036 RepID=UPI003CF2259B
MKFLSAADFDDAITAASKIQAATSYVLPSVGAANTAYSSGNFEAVIVAGQYAAGVRPGYGFHASGSFGIYLYAQSGTELRIRSNSGLENTLWHSGNSRSDAQNDTTFSQLGHTHTASQVTDFTSAARGVLSASNGVSYNSSTGAFSLTYGTAAGTVAQGNDSRILNGQIAYNRWISTPTNYSDINTITAAGVSGWGNTAVNRPASFGSILTFVGNSSTGDLVAGAWMSQILSATSGDWWVRYGQTGTLYQVWTSKQFNIASYATIASLTGYVPTSRTVTINGVTKDLTANQDWGTLAGVGGSGTTNNYALWTSSSAIGNGALNEDSSFVMSSKPMRIGYASGGTDRYIETFHGASLAAAYFLKPGATEGWVYGYGGDDFNFQNFHPTNPSRLFSFKSNGQLQLDIPTGTPPFSIVSTTVNTNLNADMVDGLHASAFALTSHTHTASQITDFTSAARASISGTGGASYNSSTGAISLTYGTGSGTAAQGNDSRILNGQIAYNRWISTPVNYADINTITVAGVSGWGNTAANRPAPFGTILTFVGNSSTGDVVGGSWASQIFSATTGDWWVRYGTTGTLYQIWTSKQFDIANYATTASLSAYATTSYVTTNYYAKSTVDALLTTYVPDSRTVYTTGSITGGGNLGIDRTLSLINDNNSPGVNMLYGTNASGVKGWYNQPAGGGSYSAGNGIGLSGSSFFVNAGTGLSQDSDGLSLNVGYTDGRYLRGVGNGLSFRVAVWNATDGLTASSILNDSGTQLTVNGHMVVANGVLGLPLFSSDPSGPITGCMYFNTSLQRPRFYNGSSWTTI